MDAVRREMGAEAFSRAMREYVEQHRHDMADGVALMEILREHAEAPQAIDALFVRFIVGESDAPEPQPLRR